MKSRDEIFTEVVSVIATALNRPAEGMSEESKIAELSADSIQLFELLLAFEKHYEMETAYDDVVNLHTIGDIIDYLLRAKYAS